MPRVALITLLVACQPEPDPTERVLDRLNEIDARLARLEAQLTAPKVVPYDAKLPAKIRLHVSRETVRFGREPLPDDALTRRLEAAVRLHGDPSVIVQADPEIDQRRIEAVMDLVKRAGVRRLALATASDDQSEFADTDLTEQAR